MSSSENSAPQADEVEKAEEKPKLCGIIRPISAMGGYSETHWKDVEDIVRAAIKKAGFEPKLVSDADEIGVIHKRIVQNLYDCPLAVCDVSGKNPNVMFELGMRLAFDKPTIIIKDERTNYSFDISVIEHLQYPSSLHFWSILDFRAELQTKLEATYKEAQENSDYSPFLKSFGELIPAKISEKKVPEREYFESLFDDLTKKVNFLVSRSSQQENTADMNKEEALNLLRRHSAQSGRQAVMAERLRYLRGRRTSVSSAKQAAYLESEITRLEAALQQMDMD